MEQRLRFVTLAQSGHFTITELCEQFGISRKTAYKWMGRYAASGSKALEDRSRAPKSPAGRTGSDIERLIVSQRRRHPTWGPKKLRKVLEIRHGIESPPACSTIGEIFKRNGLVESRRRRPGVFTVERLLALDLGQKEITILLRPTSTDGIRYGSRESKDSPELILAYE